MYEKDENTEVFLENFPWNCSSGHGNCSFYQLARRFDENGRKKFSQCVTMMKNVQFLVSSKQSYGHVECILYNPVQKFLINGPRFMSEKDK